MKRKGISILFVLLLTLMACQADDNGQQGARDPINNPNIDPTTQRYPAGEGLDDPNRMGGQDDLTNRGAGYENRERNTANDLRANDEYRDGRDGRDGDRNNRNEQSRYEVASEAADKITEKVTEIDYAYVLTTENNAYVAARLNADHQLGERSTNNRSNENRGNRENGEELTDEVKKEISDIVRSVDNDIDNVFVSTNPDFFNLTNNYTDDLNQNRPVRGMFDQIGNMVDRLFPENTRN